MKQQSSTFSGKRLVCIGAGTGQARILRALASGNSLADLTAIVSVTDNGGHSGELRKRYYIPQVGDGKQCLLALAGSEELRARYASRREDGTSPANDRLAQLTQQHGSIASAFRQFGEELECTGRVLPATESDVQIVAHLEDGQTITGEWEIIGRDPRTVIDHMSLSSDVPALCESLDAVRTADVVLIAPGSFHTGIVSALLPRGMREAILSSPARIVQVINLMTQPGLTDGWDAEQHVRMLERYLGRQPEVVIVNTGQIPGEVLDHYAQCGSEPVIFNGARQHFPNVRFVEADLVPSQFSQNGDRPGNFAKWTHLLTHSSQRLLVAAEQALAS